MWTTGLMNMKVFSSVKSLLL
ncbi:hypothetical protein Gohar_004559 [Gossypium harknessii]|uniref:Uncharacterized protein n=1 Tax=Gossypium harknessii TaxID=34285 RepID=A0A7J9H5A7_9ROSI|nr:hypothetical protein [Gossypium harknessii]